MKMILRFFKRLLILLFSLLLLVLIVGFFYMKMDKFGLAPEGTRLASMQSSSHFKDGKFENLSVTPELTEGYSTWEVTWEFIFKTVPHRRPEDLIPSRKTNLLNIPRDSNILVWFGHSSYFIQIDGKRILVDPVFSGNASPVPGTNTSFNGTDVYTADEIPDIDYLFISHDHYDHLDYETLVRLRSRIGKVICGLGVGSHFESWGYQKEQIIEKDWFESVTLDSGFIAHITPARHFSGRGFTRNNTLWVSFVVESPSMKFYFGGDSGYDTHFAEIGKTFGPIDLAFLDNGQYDLKWKYIHTLPQEVLQAAADLNAKRLFPVHSSKFAMANHAWDDPLKKITELNQHSIHPISLVTPYIGETVALRDSGQIFKQWWEGLK